MTDTAHQTLAQPAEDPAFAARSASSSDGRPVARSESESLVVRLFDRCQRRILGYVIACGLPSHDAEEVVQETFLSLFRHLELGRPRANLDGWLFRVAHNLALKRRGAIQSAERRRLDENALERQPCGAPNAEEQACFHQAQRRLRAVFEALPERDRQCLLLRAEGLKYRQIAESLGVSLGAVSLSISRSLARLARANGGE